MRALRRWGFEPCCSACASRHTVVAAFAGTSVGANTDFSLSSSVEDRMRAMAIHLDHLIVPSKDRVAAARQLGTLLGVAWAEQGSVGPFSPVYVSDGLTIDFDQWAGEVPKQHYCFRVSEAEFEGILARIKEAQVAYRSLPLGPDDFKVNPAFGGKLVYWSEPDGHVWELLTVSYERQVSPPLARDDG